MDNAGRQDWAAAAAPPARAGQPAAAAAASSAQCELDELAQQSLRESVELRNFIHEYHHRQTAKGSANTNVIDQVNKRTYAFTDLERRQLYEKLDRCRRAGISTHFSERQWYENCSYTGMMIDFDLFLDPQAFVPGAPLLDLATKQLLVGAVLERVKSDLQRPDDPAADEFHVFFTVKTNPRVVATKIRGQGAAGELVEVEAVRHGFHMVIPDLCVGRYYKKQHFYPKFVQSVERSGRLAAMGSLTPTEDAVDAGSMSNPILLPGSCKPGSKPYSFEGGFRVSQCRNPFPNFSYLAPEDFADKNVVLELSLITENTQGIRSRRWACTTAVEQEIVAGGDQDQGAPCDDIGTQLDREWEHSKDLSMLMSDDAEARYIKDLLEILPAEYYEDRNKWRNVVFALANTMARYRSLAVWFSQKSGKWDEDEFATLWEHALGNRSERPLTKNSIMFWARKADPAAFQRVQEESPYFLLMRYIYDYGGKIEHNMLAKILAMMFGHKFATDIDRVKARESPEWYEFVGEGQQMREGEIWKWRREGFDPQELSMYISDVLPRLYAQALDQLDSNIRQAQDDEQTKYFKNVKRSLMMSRLNLHRSQYKVNVIKECVPRFRRRGFIEDLDDNGRLLGVGNGVLVLGRGAEPSRFLAEFNEFAVSKFTRTRYVAFDPRRPTANERLVLGWIATVIPEDDARERILALMATALSGEFKEAVMLMGRGGGNNGKTALIKLLARTLGQYSAKIPPQLLTGEREKASSPNSAVCTLKGARMAYSEESNKADILNSARLKEVVNPDYISASDKNEKQEMMKIVATIFNMSNYDLIIPTADEGTWRRIWTYIFKVHFKACPDPNDPFQQQEDSRYVREYPLDPDVQSAFLGVLVYMWDRLEQTYGGNVKKVASPTIVRETEEFRNKSDTINRFITERIVLETDKSPGFPNVYSMEQVTAVYAEWFDTNFVNNSRQRISVTETIEDVANSVLQRNIKASETGRRLTGCRICSKAAQPIDGEIPFAKRHATGRPSVPKTPRDFWWLYEEAR